MENIIFLDYQSRTPIYQQIVITVEKYVSLNVFKPGEQIPSIRELASNLGINPNTVKKAYDELENLGVISTIPTKGTYITKQTDAVVEKRVQDEIIAIKKSVEELNKMGICKEEVLKMI